MVAPLLRVATRDDIAQIQRVRHAVRENRLTSGVIGDDEVCEHLEQLGRGWVIEVDGTIRAFAIANKRTANVWALFVEQGHEQRGHGRRLHDTMMAWFWAEGVPRVWLSTGARTRAEAFYRAAGWVEVGLTPHGEVGFEMQRTPLIGVDFSSRPTARKPIVVAHGTCNGDRVRLDGFERFASLDAFGDWLRREPRWIGGFDLPFGLPRELVEHLGWPREWRACIEHYASLPRHEVRGTFAAFCAARPAGGKFAHRACDRPAGSSPSMKWVNPPVAYMLHAGVPLLLAAGASLPAHGHGGDPQRIALEAYPGLLAREIIGARSYKSDDAARHTDGRLWARIAIVDALCAGCTRLALSLGLSDAQHEMLIDDGSGDALDAALCLLQAAWASLRDGHGLPAAVDPLEGWIVSA